MHDVQLVILFYTAITMTIMLLDLAVSMYACMHACMQIKLKLRVVNGAAEFNTAWAIFSR